MFEYKETFKNIIYHILKLESQIILWKYKPKIIAITGSVGKTSTKDAIYTVLSKFAYVRKSDKSYNSEIGLPLTILGVPNGWNNPKIWLQNIFRGLWLCIYRHKYPEWLVLEVGVGKPGDMAKTASWLKTDVVVMTAIGETPVHVEFFSSQKHLVEEKSQLIKTLKKSGILVLNADDDVVLNMKNKTKARIITYGMQNEADLVGSGEQIDYGVSGLPQGIIFRVDVGGTSLPVFIPSVFGKNHVYAVLATLAVAYGLKWNMVEASNAFKNYEVPPGRMRLLHGINDSLIIDDSYNSSPFACESALQTLGNLSFSEEFSKKRIKKDHRKIAVLGDMLELGRFTVEAHRKVGYLVPENADILVIVGPRSQDIKNGALEKGMKEKNIFDFSNSKDAGEFLIKTVSMGDIVLIKGSQGMRMERAVEAILQDKENKEKILVRQEKEWLNKL